MTRFFGSGSGCAGRSAPRYAPPGDAAGRAWRKMRDGDDEFSIRARVGPPQRDDLRIGSTVTGMHLDVALLQQA